VSAQGPTGPQPIVSSEEMAELKAKEEARQIEAGAISVPLLWPRDRPRYVVTVRLCERAGEFDCVSFSVTSLRAGTSVGTSIVRDLPVATLVRVAIQRHLTDLLRVAEETMSSPLPEMVHVHRGETGDSKVEVGPPDEDFLRARADFWTRTRQDIEQRIGKVSGEGKGRRYPPGHLEEVARLVREARRQKESAQTAVAEAFGIKRSAAANQIARARARGLLGTEEE
jgi:hypothetical protein